MRRFTRPTVRTSRWAILILASACGFFDPLDQAGLGVILLPPDTALYVGASFKARGLMVNSYGDQYPSAHLRYAGLDPSASVGPDGTVTGVSYGRARVVAMRAHMADTGWLSVVPTGTLALSLMSDQSRVDVVNTDGSGFASIVSAGQFGGGAPAWLPGNAGLVYQFAIPGGAGSTQLLVTDLAGNSRLLVPSGNNPRVARDGSWVYFHNGGEIWRVHVDGTGLERAVASGVADPVADPDPAPDGTQLVFIRKRFPDDGRFQIEVRALASGADRLVVSDGLRPRWSPSGDRIAYWSGDVFSQAGAIFVIGAHGTGVRQVTPVGRTYRPQGLDWSPDGQWLLARADSTLEVIQVATGLTLPLGYAANYHLASWRW